MQSRPKTFCNNNPNSSTPAARAAKLVWLIGITELAVSTIAILLLLNAPGALSRYASQPMQGAQPTAISMANAQTASSNMAWVVVTFGAVPGAVLVALGFLVRAGRAPAILAALAINLTQCAVLVGLMIKPMLAALGAAEPGNVTLLAIVWGTPIGVLAVCATHLLRAWLSPLTPDNDRPTRAYQHQAQPIH